MRRTLIAALLASLATAAVLAATGLGAGGSSSKSDTNSPPPTMAEAQKQMEKNRAERQSSLAKRLGVSTQQLSDALDAVMSKQLDKAVSEGRLTAKERDALLACKKDPLRCDRSDLPAPRFLGKPGDRGGRPGQGRLGQGMRAHRQAFVHDLATELGVPDQKVRDALRAELAAHGGSRFLRHGPGNGPGMGGGPGGGPGMGGPPPMMGGPPA